jgi:hypothetical protein
VTSVSMCLACFMDDFAVADMVAWVLSISACVLT